MEPKTTLLDVIKTVIITLFITYVITNMIGFVTISGESMVPTLKDREKAVLNKMTYLVSDPEQNDLVVFYPPVFGYHYIKRVIATPQDTVEIKDHKVYVNDVELDESYVPEEMQTERMPKITLLDGEYFVMGDNRNASSDSRDFGPIRKEAILGKLFGH